MRIPDDPENPHAPTAPESTEPERSEPSPADASPVQDREAPSRRGLLGLGLAGLLAPVMTGFASRTAAAATPPVATPNTLGLCNASILVLSQADATTYVEGMRATSPFVQAFISLFKERGFEFFSDRARVFIYGGDALSRPVPRLPDSVPLFSPNAVGILPSFVDAKPEDPSHRAIGITVHHGGYALAVETLVMHRPFKVVEFTVHEFDTRNLGEVDDLLPYFLKAGTVTRTISARDLEALSETDLQKVLGAPPLDVEHVDQTGAAIGPADQPAVVDYAFSAFLNDAIAKPLYGDDGIRELLLQTPLLEKLALVNFGRYDEAVGMRAGCCSSSSSSCNGCSCTSTSFRIRRSKDVVSDPA
jgi:hypothetical protein